MLETSGQISFCPKSANRPATPQDLALQPDPASKWYDLVLDGKLIEENLRTSGKDRTWLNTQLSRAGIGQLSEAFMPPVTIRTTFLPAVENEIVV